MHVGTTQPDVVQTALSPVGQVLTVGGRKEVIRMVGAGRIVGVRGFLHKAGTSGLVTFDVKRNGTSALTTAVSIDPGELTTQSATTASAIAGGAFSYADDDEISFDVVAAGV